MKKKKGSKKKGGLGKDIYKMIRLWSTILVSMLFIILIMFLPMELPLTGLAVLDETLPVLYDPMPENNSYVAGGDKSFFISVDEENLNASTVRFYIKSKESTSWDDYLMQCIELNETTWECEVYGVTLSLDIVGSDTEEHYYFMARDYSDNTGYLGNSSDPLIFTVDINPPIIQFVGPENNSYVSGTETVELNVIDISSGVSGATVKYSLDNSTWIAMSASAPSYTAELGTTGFADNESIIIYAKASDNIDNIRFDWINVTADNSEPSIDVLAPSANETVVGIILLEINVTDIHSNVDASSVYYVVDTYERSMDCTKQGSRYACNEYFDTKIVSDGQRTITFHASDNAGNANSTSIQVIVDNKEISASIINPVDGIYVSGDIYINVTVTNAADKVTGVQMNMAGTDYSVQKNMTCPADYKCYTTWDTSELTDGSYTLTANATNIGDKFVNDSIGVTLDNTPPQLEIYSPTTDTVNGTIYPQVIVTDGYGVDSSTIRFNVSSYSKSMNCARYVQGKRYVCGGNFDTTTIEDSYYTLLFYGKDLAGNLNSASKRLLVDNTEGVGPSPNETSTNQTTTTTVAGATTSTTTAGGEVTTTTAAPTIISPILSPIITPIVLTLGSINKLIQEIFKPWPVKAFAVSIIIFLIVLAIFRNAQIIRFFKRGGAGQEEVGSEEGEEENV